MPRRSCKPLGNHHALATSPALWNCLPTYQLSPSRHKDWLSCCSCHTQTGRYWLLADFTYYTFVDFFHYVCVLPSIHPTSTCIKMIYNGKCINIFMQTGRCSRNVFSPSAHCSRKSGENGHRLAPLSLINTALIIRKEQVP